MAEPTSILSFSDLLIEVAYKLGMAYYGTNGDEAPQVPTDAHDLYLCKRVVNNGIRMFINDAPPPNGWRWLRPVASLILWPDVTATVGVTVSGGSFSGGVTTITANTASFYPSMVEKTLVITTTGSFVIKSYTSSTVVVVSGNASAASSKTFSIASDNAFTMPDSFAGQVIGQIAYASATDMGTGIEWTDESVIRNLLSNESSATGTPHLAAIRIRTTQNFTRRRWELFVYRQPSEVVTVTFPYMLHFDSLSAVTDLLPAPFGFDEAIKAACMAQAEKEVENMLSGPEWTYYRSVALPNAYRVDAMSAPRTLGNMGTTGQPSIQRFRDSIYQRPDVSFNS